MPRIDVRVVMVALGATALLAGTSAAASGPVVFKADIELVNVAVTITDGGSRYVTNLGEADFQVLEDGVPQSVSLFTQQQLPVSLSILLDVSHSMSQKLVEAQAAAVRFVQTLRADDQAQVIQFNERASIVQDFTSDLEALQAAIRNTRANGATALYNALYIALKDLTARRRHDELRRLAIVVLSDGEDTSSLVSDDQVLDLARTAGIGVYGISLRPLLPPATVLSRDTGLPRFFFSALARDTGGEAHFLQGIAQLKGVYERVAMELRSQYSLGYVSNNAARDGRWRHILVRVPGRPQLQIRHKTGYYAPRP